MTYLLRELLDDLIQMFLAGAVIIGALLYLARQRFLELSDTDAPTA